MSGIDHFNVTLHDLPRGIVKNSHKLTGFPEERLGEAGSIPGASGCSRSFDHSVTDKEKFLVSRVKLVAQGPKVLTAVYTLCDGSNTIHRMVYILVVQKSNSYLSAPKLKMRTPVSNIIWDKGAEQELW
jgi:hypothetical protein